MTRCVAWLRAVNVGGRFVKMEKLRELAAAAGLRAVSTYIQSGNLLFDASARELRGIETRLETLWREHLGWEVATLVRTRAQIDALVEDARGLTPGLEAEEPRHYVVFLRAKPAEAAGDTLHAWSDDQERLLVCGRELHFWCTGPSHEARFSNARLERLLKSPSTMRDWKTVIALQRLLAAPNA